jgi:hypothetical protein
MGTPHGLHRIALLFNANKVYDRQIITGVGTYLTSTRGNPMVCSARGVCTRSSRKRPFATGSYGWKRTLQQSNPETGCQLNSLLGGVGQFLSRMQSVI